VEALRAMRSELVVRVALEVAQRSHDDRGVARAARRSSPAHPIAGFSSHEGHS